MIISISDLQEGQARLEAGQEKLEARQEKMSNDITELKTSYNRIMDLMNTLLETILRIEKFVISSIENDLRSKVPGRTPL